MLGNTPFNGATMVGLGDSASFAFGATSEDLHVQVVSVTPVTAPGTYPLLSGIKVTVNNSSQSEVWGGIEDDSGSVVVTSVANGRVEGTCGSILHPEPDDVG